MPPLLPLRYQRTTGPANSDHLVYPVWQEDKVEQSSGLETEHASVDKRVFPDAKTSESDRWTDRLDSSDAAELEKPQLPWP